MSLVKRFFTTGKEKYQFSPQDAVIRKGEEIISEKKDILAPPHWSDTAVNIVAHKYLRGLGDSAEYSIDQLLTRVTTTITQWGIDQNYFVEDEAEIFEQELYHILYHQYAAFNSPVWFNVGWEEKAASSACFILNVDDSMESITDWIKTEAMIFKNGSGAGVNISKLRSKKEFLSGGGRPSGPLSFMKAADCVGSVIKSGGAVRRSAKILIMDVDHPDIMDFINCKISEEQKARVLLAAGYSDGMEGEAYSTVAFQSSNHSLALSDDFMDSVSTGKDWNLIERTTGGISETVAPEAIMEAMSKAIYDCGDPGVFFIDSSNRFNTVPHVARFESTNPCCEFHFVNNSACNLASIRLTSCLTDNCQFDVKSFEQIVKIMVLAQDIMIDRSHYPTEEIKKNSSELRPIGLGYSDLGALLMISGLPYDSDEGRHAAAEITSLMTGLACLQSSEIAKVKGSFKHLDLEAMRKVLNIHSGYSLELATDEYQFIPRFVMETTWNGVLSRTEFRNAQTTLLAPTGTVSFLMDCATTGIEPEFSLVKHKTLSGGGNITTYSDCARRYAERMGEDLEVAVIKYPKNFQCALGADCLTPKAHIDMVAAVQPFLSGGISKTINVPSTITPAEIRDLIIYAYEQGLKGVTFYRDGSKSGQPLSTTKQPEPVKALPEEKPKLQRRKLPKNCEARRHKFEFDGIEGYLHVGFYSDHTPGELFVTVSKDGSTISGLMDTLAALTSISLQYGVPLKTLVQKFSHVRFEPSGFTGLPEVPFAKSLVDFIFRYMGMLYLSDEDKIEIGLITPEVVEIAEAAGAGPSPVVDTAICTQCGGLMHRTGTCWTCSGCGSNSGGCS